MSLRKIGKILLFGIAGILLFDADADAWHQARARSCASLSGRDQGMGAPADRIPHRLCACVAGVSLVRTRNCISTAWNCAPRTISRVLARAAGGRIGADIWQLLRSGKLFAVRIELDSPKSSSRASARTPSRSLPRSYWAARTPQRSTLTLNDLPAGSSPSAVASSRFRTGIPHCRSSNCAPSNVDLSRGADACLPEAELRSCRQCSAAR